MQAVHQEDRCGCENYFSNNVESSDNLPAIDLRNELEVSVRKAEVGTYQVCAGCAVRIEVDPWTGKVAAKSGNHNGDEACQGKNTNDGKIHRPMIPFPRQSQVQEGGGYLGNPHCQDVEKTVGI